MIIHDIHVLNYLQVIKSKGGKESETEYFAALVNIYSFDSQPIFDILAISLL